MIEELKFLGNFTKKSGGGSGWGAQGGCELRIKVFVKLKKNGGGGFGGRGVGLGGSGWM